MRTPGEIPEISRPLLALFSKYAAAYLAKHFHSIRLLGAVPPNDLSRPIVVFLNHAAWWDPLVCLFLRNKLFHRRSAFAPIEASALARYGFLKKIGFFGVEQGTTRGAAQFIGTSCAILEQAENALFLTPQGGFADVRAPLNFAPGIAHLAARSREVIFLPLAIEYSFWEERKPEVLLAFGEPMLPEDGTKLVDRLAQAQAQLVAAAIRREPEEWRILLRSRSGVSRPYDLWRWLRARLRGEGFRADHGQL
ncbi:MAG: lysophospholipid acyltransferase family protein [Spartobacteria bacterium]